MKDTKQELIKLIKEEEEIILRIEDSLNISRFYNEIGAMRKALLKEQTVREMTLIKLKKILEGD